MLIQNKLKAEIMKTHKNHTVKVCQGCEEVWTKIKPYSREKLKKKQQEDEISISGQLDEVDWIQRGRVQS